MVVEHINISLTADIPAHLILDGNGIRDRCCRVDRARRAHMFRLGPVLSAYCRPAAGVAGELVRPTSSSLTLSFVAISCCS
jgi:hypothetical protein